MCIRKREAKHFQFFFCNHRHLILICLIYAAKCSSSSYETAKGKSSWIKKSYISFSTFKILMRIRWVFFFKCFVSCEGKWRKTSFTTSHYCWKDSVKLYLESVFHILSDLYRLCETHCQENSYKILSRPILIEDFNKMNLSYLSLERVGVCWLYWKMY